MNVKPSNLIKIAVTLCCVLLLSTSCTKKEYYSDTQWKIQEITVNDWNWDSNSKSYYSVQALPDLTVNIYEDGAILGYVYWGNQNTDETQYILPYIGENTPVFERISYNVSYVQNKTVEFTYQWSDGAQITPPACNFKIVMIY